MGLLMKKHPRLIEINAFVFLHRLSGKYSKQLTLDSIPQNEWESLSSQGFHFVWMMGVWKRSPKARQLALSHAELQKEYRAALSDYKESDVKGSPYAVYAYEIDPELGDKSCLPKLRENIRRAGMDLILDYVPNHLAVDHPHTLEKPQCFVEVSEAAAAENPGLFFKTSKQRFLAHGKDPNFPSWSDTVQINYFSPQAREAAALEILKIAQMAGGIRCDMAMLGLSRVFEKTWGRFLENVSRVEEEFWTAVISKVRTRFPDFLFIAEVYWDLEWEMQQLGFHYTYDKKLYDRLRHADAFGVRQHLEAGLEFQNRSVRFIENHDELRAVRAFGSEKSLAAAVVTVTVPGMQFIQEGQMQGKQIRVPVQLGREPRERANPEMISFYEKLYKYTDHEAFHNGKWQMLEAKPAGGDRCALLSWYWKLGRDYRLTAVNYSSDTARGRVFFQSGENLSGVVKLKDALTGAVYERDGEALKQEGLYIELSPWRAHLFEFSI